MNRPNLNLAMRDHAPDVFARVLIVNSVFGIDPQHPFTTAHPAHGHVARVINDLLVEPRIAVYPRSTQFLGMMRFFPARLRVGRDGRSWTLPRDDAPNAPIGFVITPIDNNGEWTEVPATLLKVRAQALAAIPVLQRDKVRRAIQNVVEEAYQVSAIATFDDPLFNTIDESTGFMEDRRSGVFLQLNRPITLTELRITPKDLPPDAPPQLSGAFLLQELTLPGFVPVPRLGCIYCHDTGHIYRNCPVRVANSTRCAECKSTGHTTKACPLNISPTFANSLASHQSVRRPRAPVIPLLVVDGSDDEDEEFPPLSDSGPTAAMEVSDGQSVGQDGQSGGPTAADRRTIRKPVKTANSRRGSLPPPDIPHVLPLPLFDAIQLAYAALGKSCFPTLRDLIIRELRANDLLPVVPVDRLKNATAEEVIQTAISVALLAEAGRGSYPNGKPTGVLVFFRSLFHKHVMPHQRPHYTDELRRRYPDSFPNMQLSGQRTRDPRPPPEQSIRSRTPTSNSQIANSQIAETTEQSAQATHSNPWATPGPLRTWPGRNQARDSAATVQSAPTGGGKRSISSNPATVTRATSVPTPSCAGASIPLSTEVSESDLTDYRDPEEASLPVTDPLILTLPHGSATGSAARVPGHDDDPLGLAAETSLDEPVIAALDKDAEATDTNLMREVEEALRGTQAMSASQSNKRPNRPSQSIRDYFGPRKSAAIDPTGAAGVHPTALSQDDEDAACSSTSRSS